MKENNFYTLSCFEATKVDRTVYFIEKNINLIFSCNLDSGKIELVTSVPGERLDELVCDGILHRNGELILTPRNGENIWIYSLKKKVWHSIKCGIRGRYYASKMTLYQDYLYVFGLTVPQLLKINMVDETVEYIRLPYQRIKDYKLKKGNIYFRHDYVKLENILYIPSMIDNYVLRFDMESLSYEWRVIGNRKEQFTGIAYHEGLFYLAVRTDNSIIIWDGRNNFQRKTLKESGVGTIFGIICEDDQIICPSKNVNGISTVMSLRGNKLKKLNQYYDIYCYLDEDTIVSENLLGVLEIKCGIEKKKYSMLKPISDVRKYIEKKIGTGKYIVQQTQIEDELFGISSLLQRNTIFDKGNYFKEYKNGSLIFNLCK